MKNVKKVSRKCPICYSGDGEVLHSQKFVLEENCPLPKYYDVVSCCQCGFSYADVDAPQEQYNSFYEDFSKYESIQLSSGGGRMSGIWSDLWKLQARL